MFIKSEGIIIEKKTIFPVPLLQLLEKVQFTSPTVDYESPYTWQP